MKYTLLNNVYLDGDVRLAGTTYDIQDDKLAASLVERGSIVEYNEGDEPIDLGSTFSKAEADEKARNATATAANLAQAEAEARARADIETRAQELNHIPEATTETAPLEETSVLPSPSPVPQEPTLVPGLQNQGQQPTIADLEALSKEHGTPDSTSINIS